MLIAINIYYIYNIKLTLTNKTRFSDLETNPADCKGNRHQMTHTETPPLHMQPRHVVCCTVNSSDDPITSMGDREIWQQRLSQ